MLVSVGFASSSVASLPQTLSLPGSKTANIRAYEYFKYCQTTKRCNFRCQTLLRFKQRHSKGCSLIISHSRWYSPSLESVFAEKETVKFAGQSLLSTPKTTPSGHTEGHAGSLNPVKRRQRGRGSNCGLSLPGGSSRNGRNRRTACHGLRLR